MLKQVPLGGLSDHDRRETLNEASILRSAQSRHVVTYVDSWEDSESDCLYIVMEHAGEDLSAVMKANGGRLSEDDVWRFLLPVAQGLAHLHSIRVLHRDLKPANIFRTSTPDAGERVVIGDLGLGRVLGAHSDFAKTGVGTPLYFSPELCQEQPYNDKSDVWAFGCLAHELLTGDPPFTANNQVALASKIVNAPTPALPDDISPDLAFVISKALVKDPARRPSMADILSLSRVRARIERAGMREALAAEERAMRRAFAEKEAALRAELDEARAEAVRREAAAEADRSAAELAADPEEVRDMIARMAELEGTNAVLTARLEDTEARLADAERARARRSPPELEAAVSAAAAERAAATSSIARTATRQRRLRRRLGVRVRIHASTQRQPRIRRGGVDRVRVRQHQHARLVTTRRGEPRNVVVARSSRRNRRARVASARPRDAPVAASAGSRVAARLFERHRANIAIVRAGRSRAVRRTFYDEEVEVCALDLPPASRSATRAPGDSWRARGGETAAEDAKDEDASAPPSPIAVAEEKETVAVDVSARDVSKSVARSLSYDDDDISDVSGETAVATAAARLRRLSPRAPTPYSGVVFRPVAPAALTPSPPRAVPSTPERPVPRGTVKGGAPMDARALRVRLPDALAGGDASPFVAVRAWRRATRGAEEIFPAPAPVGAASRCGITAASPPFHPPPPPRSSCCLGFSRVHARGGATAAVTCKRANFVGDARAATISRTAR